MAQKRFLGDHAMPDVVEQWRHYFRLLDIHGCPAVLDVGCHEGDALALLLEISSPARAVGVDRNAQKVAAAQKRFADRSEVEIVQSDAVALPLADASFDRAWCAETLEWTKPPLHALQEIRRVLRPGGRALVVHTDFDTQVFASSDMALTRELVHAFADAGPGGTLGRDLFGLCNAAGFGSVEPSCYVLLGTSFGSTLYPRKIVTLMRKWLVESQGFDASRFDEWAAELEDRDRRGQFFYSVNRNICVCSR